MDNPKNNKKWRNLHLQIISLPFFIYLIIIQISQVFSEYFETFQAATLKEKASLIDITDYYNIFPIITSDKKIYTGIPPTLKSTTTSNLINLSSGVTYNETYILMACTKDYLLSKINIDDGFETPLLNYNNFKFPNSTCSISYKDNYVYIGISYLITPVYKIYKYSNFLNMNNTNNNTCEINDTTCIDINNENDDNNYFYFYDYNSTYLENNVIKIKLTIDADNNEPILDESFNILNYTFEPHNTSINSIPISKAFSCEIINIDEIVPEDSRLVCGYIISNETSTNSYSYKLNVTVMNSNFNGIENEELVHSPKKMPYLKLQRMNPTTIIYIFTKYSFAISLKKVDSECKIDIWQKYPSFYRFTCTEDLFYYNNQYLFSASSSNMYIKRNISNNYMQISDNEIIKKIIGYFEEERDILIFIYEFNSRKIKYFTIEGRSFLYEFKTKSKILEVKSNTRTEFNVSDLISSPREHKLLSFYSLIYYISTTNQNSTYDKYNFNKENQILTVEESLNDWITFDFYFDGQTNRISTSFFLEDAKITIKTCLFKCGHCYGNFSECDYGTCKANFSLYKESDDRECYPNDQNFPNYIYNKTTDFFEKCYSTCIFCSKERELSTQTSQHCKVCQEGYLKSYTFPGNCYPLEFPQNNSNFSKIINNIDEESFQIIDSCFDMNKYIINNTGECVDSCPTNTEYYTYYFNDSLDFSKQEESFIGYLYPLNKEKAPRYLFNKVCYSNCPSLTYEDKTNNICKCKYGWHRDPTTNEDICYDNMNYCLSLEYYYHTDDKECVLNGCKDGYYQINFECYKDKCPDNSRQISSGVNKCEFNLKYCYIDEHFQNQCSNSRSEEYYLKYDNTNTYLRFCNESILYFNQKTYLYKNICYINCPEETTANDTNNRCSCNYYIYYVNEERTDYECLKETDKCWDKKRYNVTERNECVNTQEECINLELKVLNDECIPNCPNKTEITEENGICLCTYFYYNDSNFLTCYENGKTCETENYPIKMNSANECFKNKYECIKRGFKFYNNKCYENTCPDISIEKYNDGICTCPNYYFNNSDILECFDETCEIKEYPITNMDTLECFNSLNECLNRKLKIFNDNCYNNCPANTKINNNNNSLCICSNYFYTDDNNKLICFSSDKTCETESAEYLYTNFETKECFKTIDNCINRGLKVFNHECLSNCPENTVDKNNNNNCVCSTYTMRDENNLLKCFSSEVECASQGYYFNKETKECFLTNEDCLLNNKKLFGKECVNRCPINSEIKSDPNICECSNYFYNNNGILNCFNSDKTCQSANYKVNSDTKECFTSLNDCFSKNYLYYFDNTCYKDNCPTDKIPLNSITNTNKKNAIISELNLDNTHAQKICICDTTNNYYGWTIKTITDTPIQKCLYQCPYEYELNTNTNQCYYTCEPIIDYVFNDICYKSRCPEGTHLDSSNPSSRECICEDIIKIDENTGLIKCEDIYPELYYKDPEKCPYFYKRECCLKCPENTCLTANNKDLAKCVDVRANMKIYNQICIEGIEKLVENLDDNNLAPIFIDSGVSLRAFPTYASMQNLIKKYPNLTYVDLGDCENKLKNAYNLSPDTELFILGIDTPCLYDNSSINVFNYEIYLKDGTQLTDLSACDGTKITISSNINNLDLVHFYKAIAFYEKGYDIYNRTNIFYVDPCAPAQDDGNDITLEDRAKYYFPNVSICNEGCIYKVVDFNTQRFICDCNANLTNKKYIHINDDDKEEEEETEYYNNYLEYFLSLINYKIFLCINLFFEFESFYYNAGFYISFCTMLICLILMIFFWIKGIKFIKVLLYKNLPTKQKLKELLKKRKIQHLKRNQKTRKTRRNKSTKNNKISKKNNKIQTINEDEFNINNNENTKEKRYNTRRTIKSTMTGMNLLIKDNPPPKSHNILKLNEYIRLRNQLKKKEEKKKEKEKEKEEDNFQDFIKNNIELYNREKEKRKTENHILNKNDKTNKRNKNKNKTIQTNLNFTNERFSSKDNLVKFKNKFMKDNIFEENPNEPYELITEKNIKINAEKNDENKNTYIKTEYLNKSSNNNLRLSKINRETKKYKTDILNNKIINKILENDSEKGLTIHQHKKKMLKELELKIDFNFSRLIDRRDDDIEKREFNNIPYRQALRIDKRSFLEILFSVLSNQIEFISLFLYRNPYSHYTLTVSIYLFELLLDLTMNCLLYTDDVVSEKYHNDGNLSMFTSLSLSFISNIISSIIVFVISKLTNYVEIIEAIIDNVKDKQKYILNITRLFKYIKIRLGFFYFLQLGLTLIMTYYLFIFCTVYHQSQGSIMVNYIVGACTSLAISVGLTLIISILRAISIKYHYKQLFNISKYLYEHF